MKIILYSTGCPKCKVLKHKLEEKGIAYTENNTVDEMLSLGIVQVPVLSVDQLPYGLSLRHHACSFLPALPGNKKATIYQPPYRS